jgi:putative Mg2+ transporter-C (MgtC) family protein
MWETIRAEFSDLPDTATLTRVTLRLLTAALLGSVVGFEREWKGKPAGVRTHMLVALGAALFVVVPLESGVSPGDLTRVLQGLIAGIGFLGAGAIIKREEQEVVEGLTTAANIWMTAAIGVAAGMGREATAILCTVLAMSILLADPLVARLVKRPKDQDAKPHSKAKGRRKG